MKVLNSMTGISTWAYRAFNLIKGGGKDLSLLIDLGNQLSRTYVSRRSVDRMLRRENIKPDEIELELSSLDSDSLADYGSETMGKNVHDFFINTGFDIYPVHPNIQDHYSFFREKRRKVHDLLHIVLDYGTDLDGEAEVNMFCASQSKMPTCYLIVFAICFKKLIQQPLDVPMLFKRLMKARKRASGCKNFLLFDWSAAMDQTLTSVRKDFEENCERAEQNLCPGSSRLTIGIR